MPTVNILSPTVSFALMLDALVKPASTHACVKALRYASESVLSSVNLILNVVLELSVPPSKKPLTVSS